MKVQPSRLAPDEWATVTVTRRKHTPPSDVEVGILLAPAQKQAGTDSNALRFGLSVADQDATTTSTLAATLTAWAWTMDGPR